MVRIAELFQDRVEPGIQGKLQFKGQRAPRSMRETVGFEDYASVHGGLETLRPATQYERRPAHLCEPSSACAVW